MQDENSRKQRKIIVREANCLGIFTGYNSKKPRREKTLNLGRIDNTRSPSYNYERKMVRRSLANNPIYLGETHRPPSPIHNTPSTRQPVTVLARPPPPPLSPIQLASYQLIRVAHDVTAATSSTSNLYPYPRLHGYITPRPDEPASDFYTRASRTVFV